MSKDDERELAKINDSHKRTILIVLCKSTELSNEQKLKL